MSSRQSNRHSGAGSKSMLPNGRKKGRQTFTKALHAITDHPDYLALSKQTRAFLWDFARQYNGRNNGDLAAAVGTMGQWGWTKAELKRAKAEALERRWIEVTRLPRFPRDPTLYRLTWMATSPELRSEKILDPGAFNQEVRSLR